VLNRGRWSHFQERATGMHWTTKRHTLLFLAALWLLAAPAMAALGGDAASVTEDVSRLKAQLRVTSKQGYAIHELQGESGTVVREFVSSTGKVFGVAWNGPVLPDMRQVLGNYHARLAAATNANRRPQGPLVINAGDLVLYSGGHMRAYTGRAYVPQMLPEGVSPDAIR
jgi:hypothetical protein